MNPAEPVGNLRLSDADTKNFAVTIERLKGSLKTVQPLSEHRGIPLLDEVKAIKSWLSARVEDGSGYLFLSQKGGPLSRVHFFRIFSSQSPKKSDSLRRNVIPTASNTVWLHTLSPGM